MSTLCYARPEISAHLKKASENQAKWIFEVMCIKLSYVYKVNALVGTLMVNNHFNKRSLILHSSHIVFLDGMFKTGNFRNKEK